MGCCSHALSCDSFGAVSDSSGKVILVNATLLSDFSDIIGNRHKNPFFTSNVYTHLKLEDAQREMERLERIEKVCQVRK